MLTTPLRYSTVADWSLSAFSVWTLTTALFNTIHTAGAAKGKSYRNNVIAAKITHVTGRAATIPFIFIFYLFYDIAYTPMLIAYTLEILPYAIRAKGFAIMVGCICPPNRIFPYSDSIRT